jgi:hypothetical protein
MSCRIASVCVLMALLGAMGVYAQETMYVFSNLNVYATGADGYSQAFVPYGWITSSSLTLKRDGQTVDYKWGQSTYSSQMVFLWVSNSGNSPPYTLYEQFAEVYGDLPDYGGFYDYQYKYGTTPGPTVTIQVESGHQQGSAGFVLSLGTTNLTANGSPAGGTYQWSIGPNLNFAGGSTSQNTAVQGIGQSGSSGDSWVQVNYSAYGYPASASIRFTVRAARQMVASTLGGPGSTTPLQNGYLTNITYYVKDQFGQTIEIQGLDTTEVLSTVSMSTPVTFTPPDNIPQNGSSNSNGSIFDYLYVLTQGGGLPGDFRATRNQSWTLRGYLLSPTQVQNYYPTYATVNNQVLSW